MQGAVRHIARFLSCMGIFIACSLGQAAAQSFPFPTEWEKLWTQAVPLFRQDTVEICILGDVMMHTKQIEKAAAEDGTYDFSSYFRAIKDKISDADIAIANMEFTLGGKPYSGYPCFSAPDELAEYVAECGVDVFLCANNHIFDKGASGAMRTLEMYEMLKESHGISTTGLSKDNEAFEKEFPLLVRAKGISVALVNFTYGTNIGSGKEWPKVIRTGNRREIEKAISKAEDADADITVALPHWGQEYKLQHSEAQEETAGWLIEQGADLIIGTHPHVVQDYQEIDGKPVVYSIGNAVSNMSATNTQVGLMTTIRIIRDRNGDVTMMHVEFTYLWCSRPGGFDDTYTVIPIREYLDRRNEWKNPWDYEKMVSSYDRIRRETGIEDGIREKQDTNINHNK